MNNYEHAPRLGQPLLRVDRLRDLGRRRVVCVPFVRPEQLLWVRERLPDARTVLDRRFVRRQSFQLGIVPGDGKGLVVLQDEVAQGHPRGERDVDQAYTGPGRGDAFRSETTPSLLSRMVRAADRLLSLYCSSFGPMSFPFHQIGLITSSFINVRLLE